MASCRAKPTWRMSVIESVEGLGILPFRDSAEGSSGTGLRHHRRLHLTCPQWRERARQRTKCRMASPPNSHAGKVDGSNTKASGRSIEVARR